MKNWPEVSKRGSVGNHFNGGIDAAVGDGITLWLQDIIDAFLYRIFAFGVDDDGALLGLFGTVAAYFYQGFNHPFKRIYVIIPYDE